MTDQDFGCKECKAKWKQREQAGLLRQGTASRVKLTGKIREWQNKKCPQGAKHITRQYRCLDCGYVGWSTHYILGR